MMETVVLHSHPAESKEFIAGRRGDILSFEARETTYPGWIWCTDEEGKGAWMPEAYLSLGRETCRLVRDYESRELEVKEGAVVHVLEEESGWAWIEDEKDRKGWVPLDCLHSTHERGDSG